MIRFPINPQAPQPAGSQVVVFAPPLAVVGSDPPPVLVVGSSVLRPVALPTSAMAAFLE